MREANGCCRWLVPLILVALLSTTCGGPQTPATPAPPPADTPPPQPAGSWGEEIDFEHLRLEDGLSQVTVNAILQDAQGFLWFGTQDGLNKYDGYRFTVYRPTPGENSLADSYVRALYQDAAGMLWVGTEGGGLDRFDRNQERFTHYRSDPNDPHSLSADYVRAIAPGAGGELWIATHGGGLNRFDPQNERFIHYRHQPGDPSSLSSDLVLTVYRDRDGMIWAGTEAGLDRLDPETSRVTRYHHDPYSLNGGAVRAITQDREGTLWVGTDQGADRLDLQTGQLSHYSLNGNTVRAIYQDEQGTIWVGTERGLHRFDAQTRQFTGYHFDPTDPRSLSNDAIRSITQDAEGSLWVGTYGGGVNRTHPTVPRFPHTHSDPTNPGSLASNHIWSIYEDQQGVLWVGLAGSGLDRWDPEAERFVHYPPSPDGLSDGQVRAIGEDRQGHLWLGTENGLNVLDPETGRFTAYFHDPSDPHSLSHDDVRMIYQDRRDRIWIGTYGGGLNRFDLETGHFIHYTTSRGPADLGSAVIWSMAEDEDGVLWIGTGGTGLNRFEPEQGRITQYFHDPTDPHSLSHNAVLVVHLDRRGTLWAGTNGGGLNRFDPQSGTFRAYREGDGLPNDVVYGILEDGAGRLWLSTNRGLSCFDPGTETFQNYDADDGLQSNEFNAGAYYRNADGRMFFGGINGFNAFYPAEIWHNDYIPPVVLTSLTQGREAVISNGALEGVEAFTIQWPNTYFEFEFAALSYVRPAKNEYTYMLEGFDSDWVETGRRRFGRYTNLPAGTYTLRVRGSNNDGVWNEQGIAVEATVVPPFWATWWFRSTLVLLLIAGAATGYSLRVRSLEARGRELEQQVTERTQELAAVNTIAAVVSQSFDLDAVLADALDETLEVMGIEAGGIYLLDEEAGLLTITTQRGFSPQLVAGIDRLQVGEGFSGHVAASGEALVVRDVSADPRLTRLAVREEGLRSLAVVPLISKGRMLGTLFAVTHGLQEFTQRDVQLLTAIGQQIGVAIDNARLFAAEQRRADQFCVISEVGRRITSILAVDELLNQIARLIQQTFGYYHVGIGMIEGDSVVYRVGAGELWDDPCFEFAPARLRVGEEGVTGWVAANGEPLLVPDVDQEPRYVWMRGSETRSELVVPLKAKGGVIGVLDVQSDQLDAFDESDLLVLQSLAHQAAIAIDNARLYEQARRLAVVEERQRLARELHDSVTQALYGVTLYAEATGRQLASGQVGLATEHLREMRETAQEALREMRLLIFELRPSILESEGLVTALRTRLEAVEERAGLGIEFQVEGEAPVPAGVEEGLYRIAQEALTNALKHACARNVCVTLRRGEEMVVLKIADDGIGFDPDTVVEGGGLGMESMIERAAAIGGALVLDSEPGAGTTVRVEVPR